MTNEEAIKILKKEYLGDSEEMELAKYMGWNALEKQIPKKPDIDIGYDTEGNAWNNWNCPCCRKSYLLDEEEYNYCFECGQRIDWGKKVET